MRLPRLFAAALAALAIALAAGSAHAQTKTSFKVCWSIYVGWMPWGYMADSGLMKKWADKYGISVDIVQINDYVESINQYTAGAYDGCTMTNMDALTIPAAGGVDSTALIVGDFSNGNDGIVLKNARTLADIKGRNVNLVELSVSHYLLARALATVNMTERDVRVVNTADPDMVAAWATTGVTAVTTWNPLLSEIAKAPGSTLVFDSSKIPGEIMDLMVVNTATLAANPKLGQALTGAWYEMMFLMAGDGPESRAARTKMAQASGTGLTGFDAQLKTTRMFYTPLDAVTFTKSPGITQVMDAVRKFSFEHDLLGTALDAVGIGFANGTTLGNARNVKLRFDATYMEMAASGKL